MKMNLLKKGFRKFVSLGLLSVSSGLAMLHPLGTTAQPWHEEIPPAFLPSVPSPLSGAVDYTYEYFGHASGQALCGGATGVNLRALTREEGTVGGVLTKCRGEAELASHWIYRTCQESQWSVDTSCQQSKNCLVNPPTYTPSEGEDPCNYTNGGFYLGIVAFLDEYLPGPPDVTTQVTTSPDWPTTPGWRIEYTYVTSPPLGWFYASALCDYLMPGTKCTVGVYGSSAYYKVVVHVDQGIPIPSLPGLPGPAASTVSGLTPLVDAVNTFGTLRNNWNGWIGFYFQVGATPLVVTELGRWVVSGNTGSHTVQLFSSNGTPVSGGSVTVNTSGQTPGEFAYSPLSSPLTLAANTTYAVMSQEVNGGDQWYDYANTQIALSPEASGAFAVWAPPFTGAVGGSGRSYGPVNVLFPTQ